VQYWDIAIAVSHMLGYYSTLFKKKIFQAAKHDSLENKYYHLIQDVATIHTYVQTRVKNTLAKSICLKVKAKHTLQENDHWNKIVSYMINLFIIKKELY